MKLLRSFALSLTLLFVSCVYTKQLSRFERGVPAPSLAPSPVEGNDIPIPAGLPAQPPVQPDITTLPVPLNAPGSSHMMQYAQNKVATLSKNIIDDVFPKQATIERVVVEFKDEFPGPNKETDMEILYNAIINNPEISKFITLKNAVPVYNFIKEALSNAWDKNDNLIWAR